MTPADDESLRAPTLGFATSLGGPDESATLAGWGVSSATPPAAVPGYEILSELGRGGMGVVYKARDLSLKRVVALKMILAAGHAGRAAVDRFRDEAEAVARLAHPNVVQIYGCGEADGLPYLALEFIDGGALDRKLAGTPLPPREAAALVETVARALHVVHAAGVVHRDLKPANVLLTASGVPKVADFGLAKQVDSQDGRTATGAVVGTPSYMSPEQAGGKTRHVGVPTDVYALGAILYECLTGRPPFRAATAVETLMQVVSDDPVEVTKLQPNTPRDLATVCMTCLDKDPARRYASAELLADDLRRYLDGEPIRARPASLVRRAVAFARKRPTAAAAVFFALLANLGIIFGVSRYRDALAEAESSARAAALVQSLATADTDAVPRIVEQLAPLRKQAAPLLRANLESSAGDEAHTRLALLPEDAAQAVPLADLLLAAEPSRVAVLREAVAPHGEIIGPKMWAILVNPDADVDARVRAAAALAAFADKDTRWAAVAPFLAAHLLAENPFVSVHWVAALRPVRAALAPEFERACLDAKRPDAERLLAARLAADSADGDPATLARLLRDADPASFRAAMAAANKRAAETAAALRSMRAKADAPAREANTAAALLRLGDGSAAWETLRHRPDPTARTSLIHSLAPTGVEASALVKRFGEEPDVSAKRAILLALSEYDPARVPERTAFAARLLALYRDDGDAGLHSAIDYLLRRRWSKAADLDRIDSELRGKPAGGRKWSVNGEGQTLAAIDGPVVFLMGSPPAEPKRFAFEARHLRSIPRPFAVATREVTVAEYRRFMDANPDFRHGYHKEHSPHDDGPMGAVSWVHAAAYCRWLSEREGVAEAEMVYPPAKEIKEGMSLSGAHLARTGYRLATEAEWEYACRAGSKTRWHFGEDAAYLDRYAWLLLNAQGISRPGGSLKPNDFGLFDMHGNALEWTHTPYNAYPAPALVPPDIHPWNERYRATGARIMRGGGFEHHDFFSRSASRHWHGPQPGFNSSGFRVARTIRP